MNYFLIIWFGDLISTIGSGLTAFSLGAYAFQLTGKASSTAMILLLSFLPTFLFRPLGGVLADRMNRPLLIFLSSIGSAISIFSMYPFLIQAKPELLYLYPGLIFGALFFSLQNPAYKAIISDLIPQELYSKASGLTQLSNAAQFLISPVLGGILMSYFSISTIILVDACSFLLCASSAFLIWMILKTNQKTVKAPKKRLNVMLELYEAWQALLANRAVFLLVCLVSVLLFYIGLIQALLTPMVLSFADINQLGRAQSACAVGMLAASLMISVVQRKQTNVTILIWSLFAMGICFSFIGMVANIWAVIIPGFLFFVALPFANSSIDVLIRSNIATEKQGRIWSLISAFTYLGSILAYGCAGFLSDKLFNPLLMSDGALASSLGKIFGIGPGRGIAVLFFISGMLVVLLSIIIARTVAIKKLEPKQDKEKNYFPDNEAVQTF
ncbi:MAG: MFS transporter [Tatlockia sp.]|nr:MFS transporter [Tatlockia sp.]